MAFIVLIYFVAACNVHTIKSRWTRAVSTIYLIAVGCAAFLYSPWMIISDGDQAPYIAYKWIWNVNAYLFTPNGLLVQTWDYPLVGQELIGLTAVTGVVLLIGSLINDEVRRYRQRHVEQHTTCKGCLHEGECHGFDAYIVVEGKSIHPHPFRDEGEMKPCYRKRPWYRKRWWKEKRGKP